MILEKVKRLTREISCDSLRCDFLGAIARLEAYYKHHSLDPKQYVKVNSKKLEYAEHMVLESIYSDLMRQIGVIKPTLNTKTQKWEFIHDACPILCVSNSEKQVKKWYPSFVKERCRLRVDGRIDDHIFTDYLHRHYIQVKGPDEITEFVWEEYIPVPPKA